MTIRLLTMIRIKTSMEKSVIDLNCTKKCHTTNSIINQQLTVLAVAVLVQI